MKSVHVVAAIIYNPGRDQVLIARRPDHLHQGGLWEFPGGKVDESEAALDALYRELREELDIHIRSDSAEWLIGVQHQYPDKAVHLEFWQVFGFSGEPKGNEGQQIQWVGLDQLAWFQFPEANRPVVDLLLGKNRT